jgi:hypothetical protein
MAITKDLINPEPVDSLFGQKIVERSKAIADIQGVNFNYKAPEYSQGQIALSAFERENTLASSIIEGTYQVKIDDTPDPNFDVVDYVDTDIRNSDYAPYWKDFVEVKNYKQAEALKAKIDKQNENQQIIDESGASGIAWSLAAGIFDPINLLPVGGSAYKAYKAGKIAKGIGLTAGAGAVGMTASEGVLQATQETRTLEESAINIGAGTLLAGALGGASAMLSKKQFNNLSKKAQTDINNETSDININPDTQKIEIKPDSASAANVAEFESLRKYYDNVLTPQLKAEGKEIPTFVDFKKQQQSLALTITQDIAGSVNIGNVVKGQKLLRKINLIDNLNPIQRLTQTQFAISPRETAEKLMKTGLMWQKNKIGIASAQSAEIAKKTLQAPYFNKYKPVENQAYYNFKKRIKKEGALNETENNIKNDIQFFEEFSRALRNGDTSDIPEINQLTKVARNDVLNHFGKEAVNVGLLNEKVLTTKPKTAESYFPRLFNKLKIIARENELRKLLNDTIKTRLLPNIKKILADEQLEIIDDIALAEKEANQLKIKLDSLKNEPKEIKNIIKEKLNKNELKLTKLKNKYSENDVSIRSKFEEIGDEDSYVNEITTDIINQLKGEDRLGLIDDLGIKIGKRGPLKERTLNFIQDNELEPWLENDARKVLNYYQNTLATDIEISRAFDGDLTLDDAIQKIQDEYAQIIAKTTDPKTLKQIDKEKKSVINDIDSVAKIMRGMYARPDNPDSMIVRGGRIARQYNYVTKMGQVAIASITDISNPIRKFGLKTWAKTLPNLITNLEGVKLNIKEAKLAGNITDIVAPERMASFSGLNDPFASSLSSFEKYLENISKAMSKTNLMPVWNDGQKGWTSVLSQQRMIDSINNYENLKKRDIQYLGYLGIGRDNYKIIANELKQYAYKEGKLLIANTEKWTNPDAVRIYRNALNTDIDSTIVTVGAGDLPLWAQTEAGKVIAQFKSFVFGATQQVLVSGLQQKDMAVLNGLISAVGLGMMTYYFKAKLSGKKVSKNPEVWLAEGLDRSGYFAILADYSHIADKVGLGASSLLGIGELSRYQSRNIGSSLLGPSVGLLGDAAISIGALKSGEISEADAKAIRRMIPLNNTLILTRAMDNFEKSIANQ